MPNLTKTSQKLSNAHIRVYVSQKAELPVIPFSNIYICILFYYSIESEESTFHFLCLLVEFKELSNKRTYLITKHYESACFL